MNVSVSVRLILIYILIYGRLGNLVTDMMEEASLLLCGAGAIKGLCNNYKTS